MQRPSALIQVGVITSAHGIRGQVKVHGAALSPEEFMACGMLADISGTRLFHITACGGTDRALIVTIEGINDRNTAELLKGTALFARRDAIPDTGISSLKKLTGFKVVMNDGTNYGTVVGGYNFGAGDILEIEFGGKESKLFAFNPATFPKVDHKTETVTINPPEEI